MALATLKLATNVGVPTDFFKDRKKVKKQNNSGRARESARNWPHVPKVRPWRNEQEHPARSARKQCFRPARRLRTGPDLHPCIRNTGGFARTPPGAALASGEYLEDARRPASKLVLLAQAGEVVPARIAKRSYFGSAGSMC